MLFLARCLDWICQAFASGAQDDLRINQLICPLAHQQPADGARPRH
ncbi:hypothetical protein [Sphingobium sp. CAP-1]|nr:hypothetical protein [Sphingobium sp. CAP-1]